MAISTYAELQTALENYTGRSDTAFTNRVPEFIQRGEEYINKRIRTFPGITQVTVTLAASADTAALPSGFAELIDLKFPSNDYYLTQLPLAKLLDVYDDNEARPNFFAIADTFRFDQPADQAYSLDCDYYKKWDIAADSTNALLTNESDVYLSASLHEAFKWMRNPEMAGAYKMDRDQGIAEINRLDAKSKKNAITPVDAGLLGRGGKFNIYDGH